MPTVTTENPSTAEAIEPGQRIWQEGDMVQPLRIHQGTAIYRKGEAVLGLVGPGQVVLPLPGFARGGHAVADLVAITETTLSPVAEGDISPDELETSVRGLVRATDQLGNRTIPARLAALLLEITELQGDAVVHCRQDILALAVGSRRETVAVIMSEWRDFDWIQTRYRRVKVVNRDVLRKIAAGETPPAGVRSF